MPTTLTQIKISTGKVTYFTNKTIVWCFHKTVSRVSTNIIGVAIAILNYSMGRMLSITLFAGFEFKVLYKSHLDIDYLEEACSYLCPWRCLWYCSFQLASYWKILVSIPETIMMTVKDSLAIQVIFFWENFRKYFHFHNLSYPLPHPQVYPEPRYIND